MKFSNGWKLPANGNCSNHTGKDILAKAIQLAFADDKFDSIILTYTAPAIFHNYKPEIINQQCD
jgi:hypothetical protein